MTTVGVLGPPSRLAEIESLTVWAEVLWGVDSVHDVMRLVAQSPIDLLIADASVAYLTDELVRLTPMSIGKICAVAETQGIFDWAVGIGGIATVRSFADARTLVEPASTTIAAVPIQENAPACEPAVRPRQARVVAIWGPVGAPGITTTAISLSTVCAQAGLSTLLCDVDTRGSAIAIALGVLDETPGFAAACRLAGRNELTPAEIHRVASPVEQNGVHFSVLTGLPRSSRWAEVAPARARSVLSLVREMFDVVIVDLGFGIEENDWVDEAPQRDGAAREILRLANSVVAVGSTDAVGVSRMIRGLDEIRDLTPSPVLILNRAAPNTGADAADAIQRFSDHIVRTVIPADGRRGIDEALTRARTNPSLWAQVAAHAGIELPSPRKARWRR